MQAEYTYLVIVHGLQGIFYASEISDADER